MKSLTPGEVKKIIVDKKVLAMTKTSSELDKKKPGLKSTLSNVVFLTENIHLVAKNLKIPQKKAKRDE